MLGGGRADGERGEEGGEEVGPTVMPGLEDAREGKFAGLSHHAAAVGVVGDDARVAA